MQFADNSGVCLHYQVLSASADKPTIIFINSLGTDFRIWRDVIIRLAGDFSILAYDKRGHGLSDLGDPPYTIDDHVDDLEFLIERLGIEKPVLCGLSVGGLIVQGLCERRPELPAAIILCDTAHKIGTREMWNDRIDAVSKGGIAAISEIVLERWFTNEFRDHSLELPGYRNMLERTPAAGYSGTGAAIRDADFTAAAKEITVPSLCIVGDEDGSTPPELVAATAELIPGAAFEIVAGAGHLPCIEQPEAFVDLIRKFLATIYKG